MGLIASALTAGTAQAEPPRAPTAHERASASFEQARAAFARREFTAAAAAFEQAAEYEPHPAAWLNAAEAWVRADDPVRAAADCDRVEQDASAAASYREEARTRLKTLERQIATLVIVGRTDTAAALDGGTNFSLPARRRTTAGAHVVTVFDGGSTNRFPVVLRSGETATLIATAPERPSPPTHPTALVPPPPPARSKSPPTAAWVAFGLSGAGLAATAFFGVRTAEAKSDFSASPTDATRDGFYRQRLYTNVSLGIALGAAAGGALIWILSPPKHRFKVGWSALPAVTF